MTRGFDGGLPMPKTVNPQSGRPRLKVSQTATDTRRPHHPVDPAVVAAHAGKVVAERIARNTKRSGARDHARRPRGPPLEDEFDAYSIGDFCWRHSISEAFFHKLVGLGLGPATLKIGSRTLITREAAARWRAERTAAAAELPESKD
jgi:hypothetical protein